MFAIDQPERTISFNDHKLNAVLQNYTILDYNPHNLKWDQSSFLEAYHIKKLKPKINHGIKASKEFVLFIWVTDFLERFLIGMIGIFASFICLLRFV